MASVETTGRMRSRTRRRTAVGAVAAALALLVAACGGDDDTVAETDTTAGAPTTAASGAGGTDSGTAATTAGGGAGSPDTTAGAAGGEDLDSLLEESKNLSFYVVYEVSESDGTTSTVIRAQDPPNSLLSSEDSTVLLTAAAAQRCEGAPGSLTSCEDLPKDVAEQIATAGFGILDLGPSLAAEAAKSDAVTETGEETIAGRKATCFSIDPGALGQAAAGAFDFCVDAETGLALRIAFGEQGSVEAVEVRDPTEADFAS